MKLLKKELRLALHPTSIIFLFLSAMVLIPNYPYYVIFFYTGLAVFFICLNGRENHDITYSLLLPIRKADVVKARFLLVSLLECLQIVIAIPFIIIKQQLPISQNVVGMDANMAFLGMGLLMLGIFNLIFFSIYYKNPNKVGKSFLFSCIGMGVYMIVAESLTHMVPVFRDCLDTMGAVYIGYKLVVLVIGAAGYAALTLAACKRAQYFFEKIDL